METLHSDVRYSVRTLLKSPGFTSVAVLILALGIGANTAIFSVVDTVLLRPMRYPAPERLYAFASTYSQGSFTRASPTKFNAWRAFATAFANISAYRFTTVAVLDGDEPEQVAAGQVSADFFALFGASTIQGRTFSANEDQPNGGQFVVLSHGYWQRRFGGDPRLVGKTVSVGGSPHTVVGVLSPSFHMAEVTPFPDVWLPFQIDAHSTEQAHLLWVAGRLRSDRTLAEGLSQLRLADDDFRRQYPDMIGRDGSFSAERYQDVLVRDVRPSFLVLTAAVGCVLLLACANVANLMLMRVVGRQRDIAVRVAIGASRIRIVRQQLTESVVLSLAGGACGLFMGIGGIRALLAFNPVPLPRLHPESLATIDWRIVGFTLAASITAGILFGLVPIAHVLRADINTTLKECGERSGGGVRRNKARALLVGTQMALASVLLVCSALLVVTFATLRSVDPGFASDHVLTMGLNAGVERFSTTAAVARFSQDAERRLTAIPGVVAAGTTCCLPLGGKYGHLAFDIVGRPTTGPAGGGGWVTVSPGYFDVFKIPLRRGRVFNERDTSASPPVVVISENLARRYWPTGDALGQQVVVGKGMGPQFVEPPRQIVGVVGDVREELDIETGAMMYVPTAQITDGMTRLLNQRLPMAWAVRTTGDPTSFTAAIQSELRQASGGIKPSEIRTMNELRSGSMARATFNMLVLTTFGCAALLLAAIGIYGLMAYAVQQRTREIGLRIALGASPAHVRNMVILQGMAVALAGVAIGLLAALGLTRLLASLLFGVATRDARIFLVVAGLLAVVALLSVWLPARRAALVDPIIALRST